jgi:hypothetical protein
MSRSESPALRGTLLGRLLVVWNPIMKRLLQSPLHWALEPLVRRHRMDRAAQRASIQHACRLPAAGR